jgi:hypothetical protein
MEPYLVLASSCTETWRNLKFVLDREESCMRAAEVISREMFMRCK